MKMISAATIKEHSAPRFSRKHGHLCATSASAVCLLNLLSMDACAAGNQDEWRFCKKCSVLFYNGFQEGPMCGWGSMSGESHSLEETIISSRTTFPSHRKQEMAKLS
jgi:hypothetical protein